mgnify:CR=1 FL=1
MKKLVFLLILCFGCNSKENSNFEIGIIADCQYCNCETAGKRFYRNSPDKLKYAVETLNTKKLDYTIHLGDFIDRDFKSFDAVLPIWNSLNMQKYHVLGNHDFSVSDSLKNESIKKMGIKNRYYSFTKNNWRFIVLDGNDLSFHGAISEIKKQQTDSLYQLLQPKKLPNLQKWNGGLSLTQLNWVKNELETAKANNQNVGFYCHFPAAKDGEVHNLWNYKQFLALIDNYKNVKFYFNGHNHNGDYLLKNGVHHLTFKGMVDTEDMSAFASATITQDSIFIQGHGREPSRRLKIK